AYGEPSDAVAVAVRPCARRRGTAGRGRSCVSRGRAPERGPAQRGSSAGRDRPEQAVLLAVRAGGEEECVRRAVVGDCALAELERPEPVDRQDLVAARPQLADELEAAVQLRLERTDLPIAEVADEQVAAEAAEVPGRHGDAPRW